MCFPSPILPFISIFNSTTAKFTENRSIFQRFSVWTTMIWQILCPFETKCYWTHTRLLFFSFCQTYYILLLLYASVHTANAIFGDVTVTFSFHLNWTDCKWHAAHMHNWYELNWLNGEIRLSLCIYNIGIDTCYKFGGTIMEIANR